MFSHLKSIDRHPQVHRHTVVQCEMSTQEMKGSKQVPS